MMNTNWLLTLRSQKRAMRLLAAGGALLLALLLLYVVVVAAGSAPVLETTSPPMPRIPTVTPASPGATPTSLPTPVLTRTGKITTTAEVTGTLVTSLTHQARWQWPIRNSKLVRGFTADHPGWDMGGQLGDAVTAVATGTVTFADWNDQGYGFLVVLDHGDGVQTWYAHLQYIVVKPRQTVYPGDQLGVMGGSGNADGWHLHFEVREAATQKVIDPALYLVGEDVIP
jgi:murein DD-endopeptidase MepM/ murein hydrolase activator NlpD